MPASPSYPASRNTRTHTLISCFMQAVQTVQTDCMYTGNQVPFHAFHCLFSIESPQNLLGRNGFKSLIFGLFCFHRIFFSIEEKCANTRPETNSNGSRSKVLSNTAFWALLRRPTPEKRATRVLTTWNDLFYPLRPFKDSCSFSASRSFVFGQKRPSTVLQFETL